MNREEKLNEEHYRKLEQMYLRIPFNQHFKPSIQIRRGESEIVFPVRNDLYHAANAVHGAVCFKALDDVTFFAANSLVQDYFLLTVSFNIYFLKPIFEGEMRAHGKVTFESKRLFIAEGRVFNSEGELVAQGSGSFMPSKQRLGPEVGYI